MPLLDARTAPLSSARRLTSGLLLIVVSLAAWHLVQGWSPLRLNVDAIHFLSVAASVADGEGYLYAGTPTYFPHGYPALIAAFGRLGLGVSWAVFGVSYAFFALGLWATYSIVREGDRQPRWVGFLVVSLSLLSFAFVKHVPVPTSDVPYFGLATLSAYVLARTAAYADARRWWLLLLGVALAGLAIWFRTVGIALVPAVLWAALAQGSPLMAPIARISRHRLGVAALALVALAGVAAGVFLVLHTQAKYVDELGIYFASMDLGEWIETFYERTQLLGELALNVPASQLPAALGLILAGAGVVAAAMLGYGLWLRRRRLSAVDVYVLTYLGIITVWPAGDARFMMPILPLLMIWAVEGVRDLLPTSPRVTLASRASQFVVYAYVAGFALAGLAALAYSTSLTLAGDRFPARYGSGSFESEYRLAFEGPYPGGKTDFVPALEVLVRYEPRTNAFYRSLPEYPDLPRELVGDLLAE